jgi:hypothetical protein
VRLQIVGRIFDSVSGGALAASYIALRTARRRCAEGTLPLVMIASLHADAVYNSDDSDLGQSCLWHAG